MVIVNAVTQTQDSASYNFTADTEFFLAEDVTVTSLTSEAIVVEAPVTTMDIAGTVYGGGRAMLIGGTIFRLTQTTVTVQETGFVGGNMNLAEGGGMFVGNSPFDLINHGTISGNRAINLFFGSKDVDIENTGAIYGQNAGIFAHNGFGTDGVIRVVNTGVIRGALASYMSQDTLETSTRDMVINEGRMFGTIYLGAGDDVYNGAKGRVKGTVYGEDGDDVLAAGLFVDSLNGGGENDTLDFRSVGGVKVALDGAFAKAGAAALGDTYSGFENLWGSGTGGDRLRGNAEGNELRGNGGIDTLEGGASNDNLNGGSGKDRLVGGADADIFIFDKISHGGDVITDFDVAGLDMDFILIKSAGFGAGLTTGALAAGRFRSRADNLAQDADDRFIFRNTDKTLWFDADGKGGAASKLLVDLANDVNLTAAHIVMDTLL